MYNEKLGGFVSKRDHSKIVGHLISEKEHRMITNQEPTIDKKVSAYMGDLLQKTELKTTEKRTFIKNPGGKEDERKIGIKRIPTDFGLLGFDSLKGFEHLKDAGLIHHGPIKSKDSIKTVLNTVFAFLRYRSVMDPILKNTYPEELINGVNIILKNNERETGKKTSSLDIDRILLGLDAFLDECFEDGITEEFKEDMVKEAMEPLFPLIINLVTKKPDETLNMIFKYTAVFHFIYAIRRIEKERGIKILKANSELMKILGIKKSRYYENLNLIESKFLMFSP